MTMSASLPGSKLPTRSSRPQARAALMVTASRAVMGLKPFFTISVIWIMESSTFISGWPVVAANSMPFSSRTEPAMGSR